MRNFVLATLCVVLVLSRPAVSQNAQQPSRQAVLEHDGVVWASPAAWGAPFQDDLPEDLKIAGLSKFWMEVKINFPHFAGVADLDWDKTYLDDRQRGPMSITTGFAFWRGAMLCSKPELPS